MEKASEEQKELSRTAATRDVRTPDATAGQHEVVRTEHSPLPWSALGCAIEGPFTPKRRKSIGVVCEAQDRSVAEARANAEFIVQACNLHDELVAALKAIVDGSDCACEHDTADCCANVSHFHCPGCIAAAVLAKVK
jgi:hypothetical protein